MRPRAFSAPFVFSVFHRSHWWINKCDKKWASQVRIQELLCSVSAKDLAGGWRDMPNRNNTHYICTARGVENASLVWTCGIQFGALGIRLCRFDVERMQIWTVLWVRLERKRIEFQRLFILNHSYGKNIGGVALGCCVLKFIACHGRDFWIN